MISEIAQNIPYEFVSIRHLGEFSPDKETGTIKTTMYPEQGYENYSFQEENGSTIVRVDLE